MPRPSPRPTPVIVHPAPPQRRPRPSPAEVVRAQPPAAVGVAGAAVAVLLRLVPVEARAASPARARAVLVAAVVCAIHLEALGQACTATAGPGEVLTLAGHPHPTLRRQLPPGSPASAPGAHGALGLLSCCHHLLCPLASGTRVLGAEAEEGRVTSAHSPGRDSPGLCRFPAEAPRGSSSRSKRRRRRPCGARVPIAPNQEEVALARTRPLSLRGLPGGLGGVVL